MFKQESNPLYRAFFSEENADRIQGMIRSEVQKRTGVNIRRQNPMDLFTIMSSVYSVNISSPYSNIGDQVSWMNGIVTSKCVEQVLSGMMSYKMYMADITSRPTPNDLPQNTSSYGKKLSKSNQIGI
jgi:hypothetical protein